MERAVILYKCRNCRLNFEIFPKAENADGETECPRCQSKFIREVSRRLISQYIGCSAGCNRGSESHCPTCPNFGL